MMYDFQYRPPGAPLWGTFVPLQIEGAPDHGTLEDAKVWASHYGARIDLVDARRRVAWQAHPDGRVTWIHQNDLFKIDVETLGGPPSSWAQWAEAVPASGAMAGKTAFAQRIFNADPLDVSRASRAATFQDSVRAAAEIAALGTSSKPVLWVRDSIEVLLDRERDTVWARMLCAAMGLDPTSEQVAAGDGPHAFRRRLEAIEKVATYTDHSPTEAAKVVDRLQAEVGVGDALDLVIRAMQDPEAQRRRGHDIAIGSTRARRQALRPFQGRPDAVLQGQPVDFKTEWPARWRGYAVRDPLLDLDRRPRLDPREVEISLGHTAPPKPWARGLSNVSVDLLLTIGGE